MRARARRSLPGLKAELRSKRKMVGLMPPELPPSLPFVIVFLNLIIPLFILHVLSPDPPDFHVFMGTIASGLSVLDLWRIIGILFGLYLVLDLFRFFRSCRERKFIGRVCIAGACLFAVGFQVLLHRIGKLPEAHAAERKVPLIIQGLKGDPSYRSGYCLELYGYGPRARAAIPHLIAIMDEDSKPVNRRFAAFALWHVDPQGTMAIPALARRLADDENIKVRIAVLTTLGMYRKESVVPPLVDTLLKDKDAGVRSKAAGILGHLGSLARPALPALRQALGDKVIQEDVRKALEGIPAEGP